MTGCWSSCPIHVQHWLREMRMVILNTASVCLLLRSHVLFWRSLVTYMISSPQGWSIPGSCYTVNRTLATNNRDGQFYSWTINRKNVELVSYLNLLFSAERAGNECTINIYHRSLRLILSPDIRTPPPLAQGHGIGCWIFMYVVEREREKEGDKFLVRLIKQLSYHTLLDTIHSHTVPWSFLL